MELEIRHCRAIVAVAETGDPAAAARALGLPPAATAAAVRRVEDLLGTPLFDRTGESWATTERGEEAVQRARRVLVTADSVTSEVRRLRHPASEIRVRAAFLPFEVLLPALRVRFPRLRWTVTADTLAGALAAVADGEADLVYGLRNDDGDPDVAPGVAHQDLLTERSALLVPGWHPDAGAREVALHRLRDTPWAVPAEPVVEQGLQTACRRVGFEPQIVYRPAHFALLNGVVAAAGGAVAPVSPIWQAEQNNVVLQCPELPAFTWMLAHHPDRVEPRVVAAVAAITRVGYRAVAAMARRLR